MIDLQRNKNHLKGFNVKEQILFCNSHDNIATQLSACFKCPRQSVLCENECKKHGKEKTLAHTYLSAEKFLFIMKELKDKYKAYHKRFVYEEIPKFLQTIKELTDNFISMMKTNFVDETVLTKSFCHYPQNDIIVRLLSEDPKEWNLSELTCRDVHQILSTHEEIFKETELEREKNFQRHLKGAFLKVLSTSKILDPEELETRRKKINVDSKMQELNNIRNINSLKFTECTKALESMVDEMQERLRTKEQYINSSLVIQLREKFLDVEKERRSTTIDLEKEEKVAPAMYKDFCANLFEYLKLSKARICHFYVRVPVINCYFWEKLRELAYETGRLKELLVFTTEEFDTEKYIDRMKTFRTTGLHFKVEEVEWDEADSAILY